MEVGPDDFLSKSACCPKRSSVNIVSNNRRQQVASSFSPRPRSRLSKHGAFSSSCGPRPLWPLFRCRSEAIGSFSSHKVICRERPETSVYQVGFPRANRSLHAHTTCRCSGFFFPVKAVNRLQVRRKTSGPILGQV